MKRNSATGTPVKSNGIVAPKLGTPNRSPGKRSHPGDHSAQQLKSKIQECNKLKRKVKDLERRLDTMSKRARSSEKNFSGIDQKEKRVLIKERDQAKRSLKRNLENTERLTRTLVTREEELRTAEENFAKTSDRLEKLKSRNLQLLGRVKTLESNEQNKAAEISFSSTELEKEQKRVGQLSKKLKKKEDRLSKRNEEYEAIETELRIVERERDDLRVEVKRFHERGSLDMLIRGEYLDFMRETKERLERNSVGEDKMKEIKEQQENEIKEIKEEQEQKIGDISKEKEEALQNLQVKHEEELKEKDLEVATLNEEIEVGKRWRLEAERLKEKLDKIKATLGEE